MSADEVWNLVVAIEPEGAEETQETLEETQDTFEKTADEAAEKSDTLDRFSRRWRGAMQVVTASLSVASAALLSQVPIVSDLMDGLFSIVEGVALQMDEHLRPALDGVVDGLFSLGEAAAEAEGPLGGLVAGLGGLAAIAGTGVGIAALTGNLSALGAAIVSLSGPLGAIVVAAGALAAAWATNFGDIRGVADRVINEISDLIDEHLPVWEEAFREFTDTVGGFWAEWGDEIEMVANLVFDAVGTLFVTGFDIWLSLWTAFLQVLMGDWEDAWDTLAGVAERTLDRIIDFVDRWVPGFRDGVDRGIGFWEDFADSLVAGARRIVRWANRVADAIGDIPGVVGGAIPEGIPGVPGMARGGRVTRGGLAQVHAGERVIPAAQVDHGAPENAFATQDELVVRFEPRDFERFLNARLDKGPANTGRGAGPRG